MSGSEPDAFVDDMSGNSGNSDATSAMSGEDTPMAQPSLLLRPRKNVNYAHHISLTSSDDDSDNAAEGGEAKPARPKKSYVQDDGMETSEKAKSKAMVLQAVLKNVQALPTAYHIQKLLARRVVGTNVEGDQVFEYLVKFKVCCVQACSANRECRCFVWRVALRLVPHVRVLFGVPHVEAAVRTCPTASVSG